mmetsp:Transcript_17897/g.29624  ORF Transcript_17897/g.29624 Transcript_17897/m.29624 type:complete len:254 (+) Transcript_17897:198-959(+)
MYRIFKLLIVAMWVCRLRVASYVLQPKPLRTNSKSTRILSLRKMSTEGEALTTTLDSGSHQSEMEVKKSRFLGYAQHVETWKEAQDYLEVVRAEHPKARHLCFGFCAGVNPVQERCSDDGEPTGTAGLPILGAIKGEGLSDTICIVVRYFGGIKLGAGGLIRAYGGGARLVLREAPKKVLIPTSTFRISVASRCIGSIYDSVLKAGGATSEEEYDVEGNLAISITCETQYEDGLRETLTDATRGAVIFLEEST